MSDTTNWLSAQYEDDPDYPKIGCLSNAGRLLDLTCKASPRYVSEV